MVTQPKRVKKYPLTSKWIIKILGRISPRDTEIGLSASRSNIAYVQTIINNHLYQTKGAMDLGSDNPGQELFTNNISDNNKPIQLVEDFFYDEPDLPWQPLPEHSLQESPCHPIIDNRGNLYYCKIHQYMESPYLDVIEHHCKYREPEHHKAEIIRLIQQKDMVNGNN